MLVRSSLMKDICHVVQNIGPLPAELQIGTLC